MRARVTGGSGSGQISIDEISEGARLYTLSDGTLIQPLRSSKLPTHRIVSECMADDLVGLKFRIGIFFMCFFISPSDSARSTGLRFFWKLSRRDPREIRNSAFGMWPGWTRQQPCTRPAGCVYCAHKATCPLVRHGLEEEKLLYEDMYGPRSSVLSPRSSRIPLDRVRPAMPGRL